MSTQTKKLACSALITAVMVTAFMQPAFAQNDAATTAAVSGSEAVNMEILREKVKADKKLVVANNMYLTEKEAKAFWPIYDAYQTDLENVNKRLVGVIDAYAVAYNKGAVLNDTAKKLLDDSIAIEVAETKLKQTYAGKFSKVIPAAKVARYIQIENKIRAVVRYQLAEEIPLVD